MPVKREACKRGLSMSIRRNAIILKVAKPFELTLADVTDQAVEEINDMKVLRPSTLIKGRFKHSLINNAIREQVWLNCGFALLISISELDDHIWADLYPDAEDEQHLDASNLGIKKTEAI